MQAGKKEKRKKERKRKRKKARKKEKQTTKHGPTTAIITVTSTLATDTESSNPKTPTRIFSPFSFLFFIFLNFTSLSRSQRQCHPPIPFVTPVLPACRLGTSQETKYTNTPTAPVTETLAECSWCLRKQRSVLSELYSSYTDVISSKEEKEVESPETRPSQKRSMVLATFHKPVGEHHW